MSYGASYYDSLFVCTSDNCNTVSSAAACTSSASTATLSLSIGVDGVESGKKAVSSGVAASVVIGAALGVFFIAAAWLRPCSTPATQQMEAWKPRARSASWTLAAGVFFQAMGLLTGLAGPAIPWFSVGASASYGSYVSSGSASFGLIFTAMTVSYTDSLGNTVTVGDIYTLIGGAISYAALGLFIFPSLLIAWAALCRVSAVSKNGSPPPIGCGGMPAIQGLSWFGLFVFTVGAAWDWALFGVIRALSGASGVGAGGSLMAAAFAFLLLSAVFFSVTGCCVLGPLPGVGTSKTNCCCAESDANLQPNGDKMVTGALVLATVAGGDKGVNV